MTDPIEQLRLDTRAQMANQAAILGKTEAGLEAGWQPERRAKGRTAKVAGLLVAVIALGGVTALALLAPRSDPPVGTAPETNQANEEPAVTEAAVTETAVVETAGTEPAVTEPALAETAGVFLITRDDAKAIFGVSERNGTGSPDSYTIVLDLEGDNVWAVACQDQTAELAQIRQIGQAITEPVPNGITGTDDLLIRVSGYTQDQIDAAQEQIIEMMESNEAKPFWEAHDAAQGGIGFAYDPKFDAIEVAGGAAFTELLGDSINGVRLYYPAANASQDLHYLYLDLPDEPAIP